MRIGDHHYADFDLSASGALAYVPGFPRPVARSLLWVDRQGHTTPVTDRRLVYDHPRLSPDGHRLVASVEREPGSWDLWVLDLAKDSWIRLASAATTNPRFPEWSADGRWIAFVSTAVRPQQLMRVLAEGGAPAEGLPSPALLHETHLNAWSSDGRILMSAQEGIEILSIESAEPRMVVRNSSCCAVVSPDRRFVAYVSNGPDDNGVWVRPFPGLGDPIHVSTGESGQPRWSRDGRVLFYREEGDRPKLMAVTIETLRRLPRRYGAAAVRRHLRR